MRQTGALKSSNDGDRERVGSGREAEAMVGGTSSFGGGMSENETRKLRRDLTLSKSGGRVGWLAVG